MAPPPKWLEQRAPGERPRLVLPTTADIWAQPPPVITRPTALEAVLGAQWIREWYADTTKGLMLEGPFFTFWWQDVVGSPDHQNKGRALFQTTPAAKPLYVPQAVDGPLGAPYLRLDSARFMFAFGDLPVVASPHHQAVTVLAVMRLPAGAGDNGKNTIGLHTAFSPTLTLTPNTGEDGVIAKAHGTNTGEVPKVPGTWAWAEISLKAGGGGLGLRYAGETVAAAGGAGIDMTAAATPIFGFNGSSIACDVAWWGIAVGMAPFDGDARTAITPWAQATFGVTP